MKSESIEPEAAAMMAGDNLAAARFCALVARHARVPCGPPVEAQPCRLCPPSEVGDLNLGVHNQRAIQTRVSTRAVPPKQGAKSIACRYRRAVRTTYPAPHTTHANSPPGVAIVPAEADTGCRMLRGFLA